LHSFADVAFMLTTYDGVKSFIPQLESIKKNFIDAPDNVMNLLTIFSYDMCLGKESKACKKQKDINNYVDRYDRATGIPIPELAVRLFYSEYYPNANEIRQFPWFNEQRVKEK